MDQQQCISAIEFHDLTVSYQKKPVLYGIDMQVPQGSIVGVMGPNGAGKSTLIKTLMGLLKPLNGWVKVYGKPTGKSLSRIAYVPQRESIDWDFPVNVWDVVMMGRYAYMGFLKRPKDVDRQKVYDALRKVGMESYAHRQISMLSGGQQQRVFLARALAQESDLYVMDEPFVGVDAATEAAIIEIMRDLRHAGKTLMVVHHDLITARQYFDLIALINLRLIAFGDVQDVLTEDNLHKAYGGRLNILSKVAHISAQ